MLDQLESEPNLNLSLDQVRRFHYLYERASADLARLNTFASEPELRTYLEHLVSRAYGEIHETRDKHSRWTVFHWFFDTLPQTFRRHAKAFGLSVAITLAGCAFGGLALLLDPDAKASILPPMFSSHLSDPTERVIHEEQTDAKADRLAGYRSVFAAHLISNNVGVSIKALALGMTYGIGTILVLFYNGIILGLIAVDYTQAGQLKFLLGWLMPHGVIEIPAILIAGQAGLVLAHALIGHGQRSRLATRLRAVSADMITLIFGVAILLVWAGLVEAFFSQYHEPVLPYSVKIGFGTVELILLAAFLPSCGRARTPAHATN